ncbi:hypothetical protein Bca4012_033566 [Brassica carinata]|uniref:BnaC04g56430D protein n=2 Tax=Brassica TaxID=3705 RepID=A0A078JC45_BRANA|nr:BnaC04g56430D [Brassica napus]VDD14052.1 unnamed protein product [Brassica oleracea]
MLDGEANHTIAVRKIIQEGYMKDSSSRCLGLLSQYSTLLRLFRSPNGIRVPYSRRCDGERLDERRKSRNLKVREPDLEQARCSRDINIKKTLTLFSSCHLRVLQLSIVSGNGVLVQLSEMIRDDNTIVRDVSVSFRLSFLLLETVMGCIDSVPLMTFLSLSTIQWSDGVSPPIKSRMGEDAHGKLIEGVKGDGSEGCGVRLDYVKLVTEEPTGHTVIVRNVGVVLLQREIPDSINIHVVKVRIKFVTLFDYNLDLTQRMQPQVGGECVAGCEESSCFGHLDLGGMDMPIPNEILDSVDILHPDETELCRFTRRPTETFEHISQVVAKCHKLVLDGEYG